VSTVKLALICSFLILPYSREVKCLKEGCLQASSLGIPTRTSAMNTPYPILPRENPENVHGRYAVDTHTVVDIHTLSNNVSGAIF